VRELVKWNALRASSCWLIYFAIERNCGCLRYEVSAAFVFFLTRTPMKLITTEQIAEGFEGPDIQEKIRLCVREHIDKHGYHTVILGGDSSGTGGLIPDRDTYHHNLWGMEKDVPSDVYYISPTNWDYDGDGIYGEFEDDSEAIAYPDGSVAVGRIPVRTLEDIKAYAGKVSKHLDAEPIEQLGMTCAVRSAYAKVFRSGNKLIPEAWPNGAVSFFFSDITSWDDADNRGAYDLNVANLGEKFSTGENRILRLQKRCYASLTVVRFL